MAEQQTTPNLRSLVESAQQAIAAAATKETFELPYPAPDRRPNPPVELFDKIRVVLFAAAGILLLVTALSFSQTLGGHRSSLLDASWILALSWPLVSLTLVASAGYAALPHQLSSRRQRAIVIFGISGAALMACALTMAASSMQWAATVVAFVATALSLYGIVQMNGHTARNQLERIATDVPLGLLAGVSLAYTLQLSLTAVGWNGPEHALPVGILTAVATLVAAGFAHTERGRHAFASGYGIVLLAAAFQGWRQGSTPLMLALLLGLMALVVVICAESRRFQISHSEHRAQRALRVRR